MGAGLELEHSEGSATKPAGMSRGSTDPRGLTRESLLSRETGVTVKLIASSVSPVRQNPTPTL